MKTSITSLLIAALALTTGVANAAYYKHRPHLVRHHHRIVVHAYPAYSYPGYSYQPSYASGPRPAWAPRGSCFTDDGYGRYRPCDASPSSR
jgi:hypothetical protein